MTGNPAGRRQISERRKVAYYVGLCITLVGLALFCSVFVTGCAGFGDFTGFDQRVRGEMGRALAGFAMIAVGKVLMSLGRRGLAGSGAVLDPEQARADLEPWSRMTGGMVKDALDVAGIARGGAPVVKIRCQSCQELNDESDRLCGKCGKPLA